MTIATEAYWMQRDSKYRGEWTDQIQKNGMETIRRVNLLLAEAEKDGIVRDKVSSGWRPKGLNEATKNAAKASRHISAEACDIYDPDRAFAQWCLNHQDLMCKCELWMEHPGWCAKWNEQRGQWEFWCHLQTSPPASGKRVYIPNAKPPIFPIDGFHQARPNKEAL